MTAPIDNKTIANFQMYIQECERSKSDPSKEIIGRIEENTTIIFEYLQNPENREKALLLGNDGRFSIVASQGENREIEDKVTAFFIASNNYLKNHSVSNESQLARSTLVPTLQRLENMLSPPGGLVIETPLVEAVHNERMNIEEACQNKFKELEQRYNPLNNKINEKVIKSVVFTMVGAGSAIITILYSFLIPPIAIMFGIAAGVLLIAGLIEFLLSNKLRSEAAAIEQEIASMKPPASVTINNRVT